MLKLDFIKNPYYCYIIGFSVVSFIYLWGWSDLYPTLTPDLIVFLLITFGVALTLGKITQSSFSYQDVSIDRHNYRRVLCIFLFYSIEFADAGGIPLVMIAQGTGFHYQTFGIPTFHILVQTLGPFYTIYLFHQYLGNRKVSVLLCAISVLMLSIAIVNRGSVVMTCISCLLLAIQRRPLVSRKTFLSLLAGFLLFFYGFGYVGNLRSFKDNEDVLLQMAQATPKFQASFIPNEYFWLYLYAASPLANFQEVVNTARTHRYNWYLYFNNELLPDIVARRFANIDADPDYNERMNYSIAPFLTVGTMYYDSYIRLGWYGPIITFIYYMLFIMVSIWLLTKLKFTHRYKQVAIVTICTISIFEIFDNTTRGAGLLIQLAYPFVFGLLDKVHVINDLNLSVFRFTDSSAQVRKVKIRLRFFPNYRLRLRSKL